MAKVKNNPAGEGAATDVVVSKDDLLELLNALMIGVIYVPQNHVVQVNRAIGLADSLLGVNSLLARLRAQEATVAEQLARKVP